MKIIVHKTKYEEARQASDYIFEKLNELYPGEVRRFHNDSVIRTSKGLTIDFRCGLNCDKLAGIWPNYYYTDADGYDVDSMLAQGACKVNGKRLDSLDDVVEIVKFYMGMFSEIDAWLGSRDDKAIYEGDDVIVREPGDIREIEGHSAAFCKCGAVLHIKTPYRKDYHPIKCPRCGFVCNLFCGLNGEKAGIDAFR